MFDTLLGNNHIKEILRRMLARERVPRSLLFAGSDGVGKKRFALELAKSFVCQTPRNLEACDRCAACRRASNFNFPKPDDRDAHKQVVFSEFPDIGLVIPYNKNILVDAIRDLEKEANYRPYEAKARIFIIDDADRMNDAASNALLKTLEEPSPTTHLFLVSSRPDSLLQTIRSRCQTIRFAPVATEAIERYLFESQKVAPADAELVARLAGGSIGHATDFDLEKFRPRRETMLKALESIAGRPDHLALLRIGEEINDAKNKDDFEIFLVILQMLIHDLWTLRHDAGAKSLVNIDIRPALERLAAGVETKRLAGWIGEIETLRETLAVNVNRKIATDALFVKLAAS